MENIIKEIESKFTPEIVKTFSRNHVANSPLSTLSHTFNLSRFANELIGIAPEILCGYLAGGKLREDIILKNADNIYSLQDRKGLLLCHALSPYSESIGFYCDLGRAFRISKGLDLPIKIMLAGEQWTEYNWVVQDLNLRNNLNLNEQWRIGTYKKLFDIEPDVFRIDDVKSIYNIDIFQQTSDYIDLISRMWGQDVTKNKFSDDEVEAILQRDNFLYKLSKLNIIKHDIQPIKTTIECVLRNFNRIDRETFTYFLTQFYHQSKYNGYLKISMKREKDFDDSFRDIYKVYRNSNIKHDDLTGLYFEDYKYGYFEDKPITVHPYYFPSGTLFSFFKNDLTSAINNCIMIGDYNKIEKIESILGQVDYFKRARIIADLLSFAHLLSLTQEHFKHTISKWFKSIPESSFNNSWELFVNKFNQNDVNQYIKDWSELIFSRWSNHEKFTIPYWFLPFFWDKNVSLNKQSELVALILKEADRVLGSPSLYIDPIHEGKD